MKMKLITFKGVCSQALFLLFTLSTIIAGDDKAEAVFSAAHSNDLAELKRLITESTNINMKNERDENLLFSYLNNYEIKDTSILEWLLDNGIDVNCLSKSGETPLAIAVRRGKHEAVKLLIKHGANLNDEQSPAIFYANNRLETLKLLISLGANLNVVKIHPHSKESESLLEYFIRTGSIECTLELLNHDIDLSSIDFSDLNVRSDAVLKRLLVLGVEPKLMSFGRNYSFLEIMLSYGADPNERLNENNETSLIQYCKSPEYDPVSVKILMNYGADPSLKDDKGKIALDYINEVIEKESCKLEVVRLSDANAYERDISEIKRNIIISQIKADVINSAPSKIYSDRISNKERKELHDKISNKFKELKGKTRYKEFGQLMAFHFKPPSSTVGHIIDFYQPPESMTIEEVREIFGNEDRIKDDWYMYFLGVDSQYYTYGVFVIKESMISEVGILPFKERMH